MVCLTEFFSMTELAILGSHIHNQKRGEKEEKKPKPSEKF